MARFDLTDAKWAVIALVLPTDIRDVERVNDQHVLNGIFWRLHMGAVRALADCRPIAFELTEGQVNDGRVPPWIVTRRPPTMDGQDTPFSSYAMQAGTIVISAVREGAAEHGDDGLQLGSSTLLAPWFET